MGTLSGWGTLNSSSAVQTLQPALGSTRQGQRDFTAAAAVPSKTPSAAQYRQPGGWFQLPPSPTTLG